MIEYAALLITFLCSLGLVVFLLALPKFLAPRVETEVKSRPFECGNVPFDLPAGRTPVHFYVAAMLFIVFDVELVFLFPWAVLFRKLGLFGLVEMAVFLGMVVLGFAYVLKNRALDWE